MNKEECVDKIKEIYQLEELTPLIETQISNYTKRGWSYKMIARALYYFYVVKGGDISKAAGIGIVPYVINESEKYFTKLEQEREEQRQAAEAQKGKEIKILYCKKIQKSKLTKHKIDLSTIQGDYDIWE